MGGELVFVASSDSGAEWYDFQIFGGADLKPIRAAVRVNNVRWPIRPHCSRNGKYVALSQSRDTAGFPADVSLVDAATGKTIFRHGFPNTVFLVWPSGDGRRLIAVESRDQHHTATWVWDVRTGMQIIEPVLRDSWLEDNFGSGPWRSADFSPDGKTFAIAYENAATVYNASSGKVIMDAEAPTKLDMTRAKSNSVEFTPDGGGLVTIRGAVCAWDLTTGRHSPEYLSDNRLFYSHSLSANGKRFAYTFVEDPGGDGGFARDGVGVFDLQAGRVLLKWYREGGAEISAVAISPDGSTLAASSDVETLIFAVPTLAAAGK